MNDKIKKLKKMGKHIKILYVEDDNDISEELALFLRKIFQNVDVAQDGVQGIKLYEKSRYDIVITDIEMPNMNGINMIKKIRQTNKEQIIVVTSAYNDTKYLLELIENGVDKFITKPFDMIELFKVISNLVIKTYKYKKEQKEEKKRQDALYVELEKLKNDSRLDSLTSLYTIDTFIDELDALLDEEKDYDVLCFGLKNLKEFIHSFGVKSLRDMYKKVGNNLITYFVDEIADGYIRVYYFDTNHFVILVEHDKKDILKKSLNAFGNNFSYTNKMSNTSHPMLLDILSTKLDNTKSANENLSEIENRLHMLNIDYR